MLYKYLPPSRINVLKDLEIRFTQAASLNDPFESIKCYSLPIGLSILGNFGTTEMEIIDARKKIESFLDNSFGILSLSRFHKSLLMWSHYADSHRGFVIGFKPKSDFIIRPMNSVQSSPFDVIYSNSRPVIDRSWDDLVKVYFGTKSIEWAYEEEVRVLAKFSDKKRTKNDLDDFGNEVHLFDVPIESIGSIYIGADASEELRNTIKELIASRGANIPIFEMGIDFTEYRLTSHRVPLAAAGVPYPHELT